MLAILSAIFALKLTKSVQTTTSLFVTNINLYMLGKKVCQEAKNARATAKTVLVALLPINATHETDCIKTSYFLRKITIQKTELNSTTNFYVL